MQFVRQIEHVNGARVSQKTFLVVLVKRLNLGGIGGTVQQILENFKPHKIERGDFFLKANLREGKAAIYLPVDDEFLSFGENFQEKVVVREVIHEFPRYEKKFRVRPNQFVESRRRCVFLPSPPQAEQRQPLRQYINVRVKTQPYPHQIVGQLPKPVHLKQTAFFVKFAPQHRRRVA